MLKQEVDIARGRSKAWERKADKLVNTLAALHLSAVDGYPLLDAIKECISQSEKDAYMYGFDTAVKFMRDNHTPRDSVLSILSKLS